MTDHARRLRDLRRMLAHSRQPSTRKALKAAIYRETERLVEQSKAA